MTRAGMVVFLWLCLHTSKAGASWQVLDVPGVPVSIQVVGEEHFVVGTSTGYYRFRNSNTPTESVTASLVRYAFVDGRDCLGAWFSGGNAIAWANPGACGAGGTPAAMSGLRRQLRLTSSGSAFATTDVGQLFYGAAGPSSLDAVVNPAPFSISDALSAHALGGTDYALLTAPSQIVLASPSGVQSGPFAASVTYAEVHLFGVGTLDALLVRPAGGMDLVRGLINASAVTYLPVVVPAEVTQVASVSLKQGRGDLWGEGFGLAMVTANATPRILSAVPNPSDEGRLWQYQTIAVPAFGGQLSRLACMDAMLCVALTINANTSNVLVYRNTAGPQVTSSAPISLIEEGPSVPMSVNVADSDGDAVYVTWNLLAPDVSFELSPSSADGKTVNVAWKTGQPSLCAVVPKRFSLGFHVSDGVAAHVQQGVAQIEVVTPLDPLSSITFTQQISVQNDAGALLGSTAVEGINCVPERSLTTSVRAISRQTGDTATNTFAAPGDWQLSLPPGCSGGTFDVTTDLISPDAGVLRTIQTSVETAVTRVEILGFGGGWADAGTSIPVACGEGGEGTLTAVLGACTAASVRWTQTGGAAVGLTPVGNALRIKTDPVDLESLLGETLSLRATADAGGGNIASAEQTLQFVAEPRIVEVVHSTSALVVNENAPVDVLVTLRNTSACGLTQAQYRETMTGLDYIEGSARVDGELVSASILGDALVFPVLSLAPGQTRSLRYAGRPQLMVAPRPSGAVWVKGVPVSEEAQGLGMSSPGCGCDSTSSLAWVGWMLWTGVSARARRRQGQRPTDRR